MYVFPWKLVVTEDCIIISDPSYTTKSQAGLAKIKNLKTWKYNVWEISKENTNEYWLFHESLSEEDLKNEEELTLDDILTIQSIERKLSINYVPQETWILNSNPALNTDVKL